MASTPVEIQLPSGLTATLSLYADGSDTLANSGGADTLTEATNRKGLYTATVTEALSGLHFAKVLIGANVVATGWINLEDDTTTYSVGDSKTDATNATSLASIVADTNELQADLADGGRLDLLIDEILADVTGLNGDAMRGTDSAYTGTPPTAAAIRAEVDSNSTQLASIVSDTNELQADWADGGRLDLIVDSILDDTDLIDDGTSGLAKIATDVAAVLVDTGTTVPAQIAALNDLSAAQVNAEVLDVLNVDTFAESSGVPASTTTIVDKVGVIYDALINEVTVSATKKTFKNAAGTAQWEKDLSDSGTVYTETKGNAP